MSCIEAIFEEMMKEKRLFNDFIAKIEPWQDWIPPKWKQIVDHKNVEFIEAELQVKNRLALVLKEICYGNADKQEMVRLLDEFNGKHPCSIR